MNNVEYSEMAQYYDMFYANKNYNKEVDFIKNFISSPQQTILDAGCGTGNHAVILNKQGFNIEGFDKSEDMIKVANNKLPNKFFVDDMLNFTRNKKYDIIISFFAVFNHFRNYHEFSIALNNLKNCLNSHGTIIIDLHNPQKSGNKTEKIDNATRVMKWRKCNLFKKEYSTITYIVDDNTYTAKHTFKIYSIKKLFKLAQSLQFKSIKMYENYDINSSATSKSKNIQLVLTV